MRASSCCAQFDRFSRYLPDIKTKVFYGGVPVAEHKRILKSECPHIIVGTPGRILQLVREKELSTKSIKHFILDECDKMLEQLDMRRDVQEIFKATPHEKQVMMFSATLAKEIRPELLEKGGSPKAIVDERGLGMISDPAAITAIVDELLAAHPDEVEAFRGGKNKLQGFFVGQLMKKTGGKADPKLANQILSQKLKG